MTVLALISAKHSPGVTTTAIALTMALAERQKVALIEADPAGGDLAARMGMSLDPGLATLAAAGRHPGARLDLARHSQLIPTGGSLVAAPTAPDRAAAAVASVASRLPRAVTEAGFHGIVDCGRWWPGSPATAAIAASDLAVLVLEPTVSGVDHARARAELVADEVRTPLALLLLGDRPYRSRDLEEVVAPPVLGTIAVDPGGVAALSGGASLAVARRSHLVRSARAALRKIEALVPVGGGVRT